MSYYLSKKDKEFLVPLMEKMRRSGEDIVLPSNSPERLLYLIRNGFNTVDDWKELKDKYMLKLGEKKVILRIKSPQIELGIDWVNVDSPSFLELCGILFKKPEGVKVTNYVPSESERFKLDRYCDNAGYKINTILPSTLEIKKI